MSGRRFGAAPAAACLSASLLLGACGAQTKTQGSDAGTDASSDLDAACVSACPVQEPEAGDPCSATTCAYAVDGGCARAYQCLGNRFQAPTTECPQPQGAGCPATAEGIAVGEACDYGAPACGYPGKVCQCVPLAVADAANTWYCIDVAAGCPSTPPAAGTPCSPSLDQCAYGANPCAARGFGFFGCVCGLWTEFGPPPCK